MSVETIVFNPTQFADILRRCWPHSNTELRQFPGVREALAGPLYDTLLNYQITTPLRVAHFLGHVGHESGKGKYTEELASGRAYERRKDLGNVQRGDGVKFKGRGLIELRGRGNVTRYARYAKRLDLIDDPRPLATLTLACDSAGWFWQFGTGAKIDLNRIADKDDSRLLTKLINGGFNGLADRQSLTRAAKRVVFSESTRIVQEALNASRLVPSLEADGNFGPRTMSAVRDFQTQFFSKPDGRITKATWDQLKRFAT